MVSKITPALLMGIALLAVSSVRPLLAASSGIDPWGRQQTSFSERSLLTMVAAVPILAQTRLPVCTGNDSAACAQTATIWTRGGRGGSLLNGSDGLEKIDLTSADRRLINPVIAGVTQTELRDFRLGE